MGTVAAVDPASVARSALPRHLRVLLVVAVSLAACGGGGGEEEGRRPLSTAVPRKLSPRKYLTEVQDVVQDRAYYADRVDWATWEGSVPDVVAGADDSPTPTRIRSLPAQLSTGTR